MRKISEHDRIILEALVDKYGKDNLLNEAKIPRKLATILGVGAIAGGLLLGHHACTSHRDSNTDQIEAPNNPYGINNYDYLKILEKQKAVKTYISSVLALHNKSLSDLRFNPDYLVLACYEHEYDLPLLLAQLQIESHFGTTPRAQRTNSMFSVGAYDNGTDAVKYKDQDSSIVPYIELIKKNYLQDDAKDVEQLLQNFVDKNGNRYASNPNYENHIRLTRDKIIKLHPELLNDYICFD